MEYQKCHQCNGRGTIVNHMHYRQSGQRSAGQGVSVCPSCNGSGNNGALVDDAAPATQDDSDFIGSVAKISAFIFAIVGAIIGWNQSGKMGAVIGFIAGAMGGGVLAQFRVGRYIFGAIIVGTILFVGAAIVFGPTK